MQIWRIVIKFDTSVFFENLSRKFKFRQNLTRPTDTLRENQYTILTIYRSLLLRMRTLWDKFVEKIKAHISCSVNFCRSRAVYEMVWNVVQPDRPQTTICPKRIARRVPKATDIHSEYVILTAFPLQKWLHEWVLCLCLHIHSLSCLMLNLCCIAKILGLE